MGGGPPDQAVAIHTTRGFSSIALCASRALSVRMSMLLALPRPMQVKAVTERG